MHRRCSIIIRTKNEERWIGACLEAVFDQSYPEFEVVLVDNASTDKTLEKAGQYPLAAVTNIEHFRPGAALNAGIRASSGDYIVCLSGHCIPTTEDWLTRLVATIEESEQFAGVYGRQEPMSFSTPADKRDLLLVFGLDRKVQRKDSFFHNANSILRRELWETTPFDESTTNLEDRIWAEAMIRRGYQLVYEPSASVYHYHGIHHNGDVERCANVVRIIENLSGGFARPSAVDPARLKVCAIIPQRGRDDHFEEVDQLKLAIQAAQRSRYVSRVVVSTDSPETAERAKMLGAEVPFLRSGDLAREYVSTDVVLSDAVRSLEERGIYSDLIVYLEPTFPFRPPSLVDAMIDHLLEQGWDELIAGRNECHGLWLETETGHYDRVDSGDLPRKFKERTFISYKGLGYVTYPENIRSGGMTGQRIGIFPVEDGLAAFEVRDEIGRRVASRLLDPIGSGQPIPLGVSDDR